MKLNKLRRCVRNYKAGVYSLEYAGSLAPEDAEYYRKAYILAKKELFKEISRIESAIGKQCSLAVKNCQELLSL